MDFLVVLVNYKRVLVPEYYSHPHKIVSQEVDEALSSPLLSVNILNIFTVYHVTDEGEVSLGQVDV
jgi:hypothetical protein